MGFNLEDKIRWEELAPSLQEKFKNLQNLIKEATEAIDKYNGASFKSWNMKCWETSHVFTDLSFYETMRVTQSGSNNKITAKTYNNILGNLYQYPTLSEQAMWIKHQLPCTLSDGVHRVYLGGRDGAGGGVIVYQSDEYGLNFTKVANLPGTAIWDMVEFKGYMYVLVWNGGTSSIYRTSDGLIYNLVRNINATTHAKTLCVFQNILYCITSGVSHYTVDGDTWNTAGGNGINDFQIYSRYCSDTTMYIGTCYNSCVYASNDGLHFKKLWQGDSTYTRWICAWKPKNNVDHPGQDVEYIIWGTGGIGTEVGTARLMMYDPIDNTVSILFNFRGDNYPADAQALNYGHAPIEPAIANASSPTGYIPGGFRERQIRYIEVFENDYTGESFLIIGTSDSHFYKDHKNTTLVYQECDYNTNTVTPIINEETGLPTEWDSGDKEAWMTDNVSGEQSEPTYMGNVYAIGPRNPKAFKKNDLVVTLIKHTEDTRVYSMSVFTDPDGVKWAYAGTGGGNYSGKGLLYRFGYSDMLDLIEAAKIGAIFPPRWAIEGQVNKRVRQDGSRLYLKIMGGCSARDSYTEMKFGFSKNFIKSTKEEPYIQLIANQYNSANCYIMRYLPLLSKLQCIVKINNVETIIKTVSIPLQLYTVHENYEAVNAPEMGPFYMMAIEVGQGEINPNSTSSFDKFTHDSLDGTIKFLFKTSETRDDVLTDSSIVATHDINYEAGERKNIGIYGLQTFDCPGLYLISTKQCSLYKHQLDRANQSLEGSGEIVFGVY